MSQIKENFVSKVMLASLAPKQVSRSLKPGVFSEVFEGLTLGVSDVPSGTTSKK